MKLFDIGINLTNKQFDLDREAVIHQAMLSGVERMVITGTDIDESITANQLCKGFDGLYSTAGIHPHDASQAPAEFVEDIKNLYLNNQNVVAIGECGLDFNRNYSPQDIQLSVFQQQLILASELDAPIFSHQRDAHNAFIQVLDNVAIKPNRLVVHCFTGSEAELNEYIDRGYYIGITGWICDERRGKSVLDIVPLIPNDRLLIETDSPFLIPRDLKPKPKSRRNLPEYLPHILQTIAEVKEVDTEALASQVWHNSCEFFKLSKESCL
ncbi:TatD family hydrolase [Catenovulum maritimum]|uniref:DNase TatD n=1 Tax=Catenovulum maritimum TaxID=1513271 RepID=A0A0J8JJN9_9ALTE|nr:TatD family hydrolase [Catenovulum maritimum]KMT64661.1 DNase TatD [Catenovulum maritimum]